MLIFINTLIGILVILSVSICLFFKSVFACLMAFSVLFVASILLIDRFDQKIRASANCLVMLDPSIRQGSMLRAFLTLVLLSISLSYCFYDRSAIVRLISINPRRYV